MKQFAVVKILKIGTSLSNEIDALSERTPIVGDIATIIEIYSEPIKGLELECCDDDGNTIWVQGFASKDIVLEKVR